MRCQCRMAPVVLKNGATDGIPMGETMGGLVCSSDPGTFVGKITEIDPRLAFCGKKEMNVEAQMTVPAGSTVLSKPAYRGTLDSRPITALHLRQGPPLPTRSSAGDAPQRRDAIPNSLVRTTASRQWSPELFSRLFSLVDLPAHWPGSPFVVVVRHGACVCSHDGRRWRSIGFCISSQQPGGITVVASADRSPVACQS